MVVCEIKECGKRAGYGYLYENILGPALRCKTHKSEGMIYVSGKRCEEPNCFKFPIYGYIHRNPLFCKIHKLDDMINVIHKLCETIDCNIRATYGFIIGKPINCNTHKIEGMFDVANKKCEEINCLIQPRYGYKNRNALRCYEHRLEGMIDVVDKRCELCNKSPLYGYEFGKALRCKTHKLLDMFDVVHKKCEEFYCIVRASYGFKMNFPLRCKTHILLGMFDVVNKKCEEVNCLKQPRYGYIKGQNLRCYEHKLDGMNNNVDKLCIYENCKKHSIYGYKNEKALFCREHKLDGMINLRECIKCKCEEENCNKIPSHGYEKGKPIRCAEHKIKGMFNVKYNICLVDLCETIAKYGTYESGKIHCYKHRDKAIEWKLTTCKNKGCRNLALRSVSGEPPFEFCDTCAPEEYLSKIAGICSNCGLSDLILDSENNCYLSCSKIHKDRIKYSETKMLNMFTHKKWKFISDKTPDNGCSRRRPDFVFDLGIGILIVENDENQHKSYPCECEQVRMIQIHQDYGGLPVHFIRFNPDKYRSSTKVEILGKRLNFLCDVVQRIKINPTEFFTRNPFLTVSYLYYDDWDGIWKVDKMEYQ